MSTPEELIEKIETASNKKYIKKEEQKEIKEGLNYVESFLTNNEKKQIADIIEIISRTKIKADDKKELNKVKPTVVKIIKKYSEKFNEEPNADLIDDKLNVTEIEQTLDMKVPKYNKYNDKHPMEGITFNETKNKYQIKYDDIDTYKKNIEDACDMIKEKIDLKFGEKILEKSVDNFFVTHNHYFIFYEYNEEIYFDIQHCISLLNLKPSYIKQKYNEFSNQIVYYTWHKNEFGGYILRELITSKTMYKLIFSSNSTFSKAFKDDMAEILDELRKKNKLEVTNDGIKLKKSTKKYKNADTEKKEILENMISTYTPCQYTNPKDLAFVKALIVNGTKIPVCKYLNQHVLYAFIMPLRSEHFDIIIKFGYTEDIFERINVTLPAEYKCSVYLIGLKIIKGRSDEKIFHDTLKMRYSELYEGYENNGKGKIELYKLHPMLITEFNNFLNDQDSLENIYIPKEISKEEQNMIETIQKQDIMFDAELDKINKTCETQNINMENDKKIINEMNLCDKKLELIREERKLIRDKYRYEKLLKSKTNKLKSYRTNKKNNIVTL